MRVDAVEDRPLRLEDFADKVGQDFRLSEPGLPPIRFKLKETEALAAPRFPSGTRSPFSLIFLAPNACLLPQRLYRLDHEKMGALTIFLVPIGRNADGVSYQALFN